MTPPTLGLTAKAASSYPFRAVFIVVQAAREPNHKQGEWYGIYPVYGA
jgi:hypothetical protein